MLKRTGIVRRMDDLGRITFPREFRELPGFKEGDPLELGMAETGDGQKYLFATPYLPGHDAFKEFMGVAAPLLRPNGFVAIFSVDKALQYVRQNGLSEAQCLGLAAGLREVIHKSDFNKDGEVLNLDGGWPLYITTRFFACNGKPAGCIMLGQASKDGTCLTNLHVEARYMVALAEQIFEKAGWM